MVAIPVWAVSVGTIFLVTISIEIGYRMGCIAHQQFKDEMESASSVVSQSVLALAAFMLAFAFGIAANRLETRKQLVREEANAIGTAWLRATFLSEQDCAETRKVMKEYVVARIKLYQSRFTVTEIPASYLEEVKRSHNRLWDIAVANARENVSSHVTALYVQSLNELFDIHSMRIAHGPRTRIPTGIWLSLYGLVVMGMTAAGYQMGISGSKRPKSRLILAVSFALVISLITDLDRPGGGFIGVSHQPLIDLHASMAEDSSKADTPLKESFD